ncbi:MAG TPA: hypothetical protein VF950_15275 [Planctomycetota bacterium]
MKLGTALLFAILGGCAVHRELPAPAGDVRGAADDLRVDHEYRPAPTGADILAVSYDHPPRDYYKIFWGKGYRCASPRPFYGYGRRCY